MFKNITSANSGEISYNLPVSLNKREIRVNFKTEISLELKNILEFKSVKTHMNINPERFYTNSYTAKNKSDGPIFIQAIPHVSPISASLGFQKLECFCFITYELKPSELIEFPMKFVIDSDIDKNIEIIYQTFTFFKIHPHDTLFPE